MVAILAVLLAAAAGLLIGLVVAGMSIVRGVTAQEGLVTPAAYRIEQTQAKRVKVGEFGPDTAWPSYPLRQARADLLEVRRVHRELRALLWRGPTARFLRGRHRASWWWWLFPVPALTVEALLVADVISITLLASFGIATAVCMVIGALLFGVCVAFLRLFEGAWRRMVGAQASCPRCYLVTNLPAYRCGGCLALHRDLRPSRLGAFARRCDCGTLLPTMVLRAARRLDAVCQRCHAPLPPRSAAVRDLRLGLFGESSAGKTRLLYAGLDRLIAAEAHGAGVSFVGPHGAEQARGPLDAVRSGCRTPKTIDALPTAVSCALDRGSRRSLVHVFDTSGSVLRSGSRDALGFLDRAQGLVYVVDPLSLQAVRDKMVAPEVLASEAAYVALGDPGTMYGEVMVRVRGNGIAARSQRLAVVVSKADLLVAGGLDLPLDSDGIGAWLMEMGAHNLVLSARRDFAAVQYFMVASVKAAEVTEGTAPDAPLRWLLASSGVRLAKRAPLPSAARAGYGVRVGGTA